MSKSIEELKTARNKAESSIFAIIAELENNFGVLVESVKLRHCFIGNKKSSYQAELDLRVL